MSPHPTEAASVGAVGATTVSALRGQLRANIFVEVARRTAVITSMIFIILFGASVFAIVFRQMGGDKSGGGVPYGHAGRRARGDDHGHVIMFVLARSSSIPSRSIFIVLPITGARRF